MKITLLGFTKFMIDFTFGAGLALLGYPITTWQWWAMVALYFARSTVSRIEF